MLCAKKISEILALGDSVRNRNVEKNTAVCKTLDKRPHLLQLRLCLFVPSIFGLVNMQATFLPSFVSFQYV